jgi:hypothetical protein
MSDFEEEEPSMEDELTYYQIINQNLSTMLDAVNKSAMTLQEIVNMVDSHLQRTHERIEFMERLELEPQKVCEILISEIENLSDKIAKRQRDATLKNLKDTFGIEIPEIIFDYDDEELKNLSEIDVGDTIICEKCGGQHRVEPSTDINGEETEEMVFVQCPEKQTCTLVGIKGKDIRNFKREEA